MNSIYLIDFPNVREKGLKGIRQLDETDTVYIYHNALFSKATYECIQDIRMSRAKIELVDTGLFLSMLEVQLANNFGQLAVNKENGCVCVVSKRQSLRSLMIDEKYKSCSIVFSESIEKCSIPEYQDEAEELPEELPPYESSSTEEASEESAELSQEDELDAILAEISKDGNLTSAEAVSED